MSQRSAGALSTFVEAWATEFVSSIEMFTGSKITMGADRPDEADAVDAAQVVIWIEQQVSRGRTGRVWVGVPASGMALVESSAPEIDGQLSLLREVLDQSVKSAGQALNIGVCPGFQCVGATGADAPPASISAGAARAFLSADGTRVVCLVRSDAEFEALLLSDASPASGPSLIEAAPAQAEPAVFERFAGVELPVSVVLGRATLKVRDVLKLAVGSLIELDTRTTDPVDVCVHDGVVARGEVVSIRGNYGIRILELTNQRDRLSLQLRSRHPLPAPEGAARQARVH